MTTLEKPMPTAVGWSFDLGSMTHTATASESFIRLLAMGLAERLTTIWHEMCGLGKLMS